MPSRSSRLRVCGEWLAAAPVPAPGDLSQAWRRVWEREVRAASSSGSYGASDGEALLGHRWCLPSSATQRQTRLFPSSDGGSYDPEGEVCLGHRDPGPRVAEAERALPTGDRRVIRSRGRGVPGSQGSWPPGRRGRARSSHHRLAAGGVCARCACVVRGCLLRCAIVVKRCRASRGPPESCFVACGSSHISATGSTAATQPPAFWSWRTSSSKVSVNRSICVHSQSPTGV